MLFNHNLKNKVMISFYLFVVIVTPKYNESDCIYVILYERQGIRKTSKRVRNHAT